MYLLLGLAGPAFSQDQREPEIVTDEQWQQGFHGFASLLRKKEIGFFGSRDQWAASDESQSILIVLGIGDQSNLSFIEDYVARGGTVLFASDTATSRFSSGAYVFQIEDLGNVVPVYSRERFLGLPECPLLIKEYRIPPSFPNREHPLVQDVSQIATNKPAAIASRGLDFTSKLLLLPRLEELSGRVVWGKEMANVYENSNGGRILVLSDQSVFANQMLGTADNLQFALNTIEWLDQGLKKRCLMLVDGELVIPSLPSEVELYTPPPDAKETMDALRNLWMNTNNAERLELVNGALSFAQEERMFDELISSISPDDFLPEPKSSYFWQGVLFLAVWGILIVFVHRLSNQRKKPLSTKVIDGLLPEPGKEDRNRMAIERFRAAEATFIYFFNEIGMKVKHVSDVDPGRITVERTILNEQELRKEIMAMQSDLQSLPTKQWTVVKLEDFCKYIADLTDLYQTGGLKVTAESRA